MAKAKEEVNVNVINAESFTKEDMVKFQAAAKNADLEAFEVLSRTTIDVLRKADNNGLSKSQQRDLDRIAEEEDVISFLAMVMQVNANDEDGLTQEEICESMVDLFDILKQSKDKKHFDNMLLNPADPEYKLEEGTQETIMKLTAGKSVSLYKAFHDADKHLGEKFFDFLKDIGHALVPVFKAFAATMIKIGSALLSDLVGKEVVGEVGEAIGGVIVKIGDVLDNALGPDVADEGKVEEAPPENNGVDILGADGDVVAHISFA